MATVGSCGGCWKLRLVAGKENALSILSVIFSVQLQQTEISDRKLFIFLYGFGPVNVLQYCSIHVVTQAHS